MSISTSGLESVVFEVSSRDDLLANSSIWSASVGSEVISGISASDSRKKSKSPTALTMKRDLFAMY